MLIFLRIYKAIKLQNDLTIKHCLQLHLIILAWLDFKQQ